MQQRHLNQIELSRRWNISHRTLERWRSVGQGPNFLKLGGRVLYRLVDIEAYEQDQLQRAIRISDAVAGAAPVARRLTADPQRATGQADAARWTARAC